jgi:AcrR family transcriptional regulator
MTAQLVAAKLKAYLKNAFWQMTGIIFQTRSNTPRLKAERRTPMTAQDKYNRILDALMTLLENKNIKSISVSEIANTAGIAKGSIYYYFPSKDAIIEALVERSYSSSIETAKQLAKKTDIPPFTRMALIFQACRNSSLEFLQQKSVSESTNLQGKSMLHHKYLNYIVSELKPVLTEIICQGIKGGEISFDYPEALAEITLLVLTVKFDNTLIPSSPEEIKQTILGLITLLEKGTGNPKGSLNFLTIV